MDLTPLSASCQGAFGYLVMTTQELTSPLAWADDSATVIRASRSIGRAPEAQLLWYNSPDPLNIFHICSANQPIQEDRDSGYRTETSNEYP